jgi:hypothetical protein
MEYGSTPYIVLSWKNMATIPKCKFVFTPKTNIVSVKCLLQVSKQYLHFSSEKISIGKSHTFTASAIFLDQHSGYARLGMYVLAQGHV